MKNITTTYTEAATGVVYEFRIGGSVGNGGLKINVSTPTDNVNVDGVVEGYRCGQIAWSRLDNGAERRIPRGALTSEQIDAVCDMVTAAAESASYEGDNDGRHYTVSGTTEGGRYVAITETVDGNNITVPNLSLIHI